MRGASACRSGPGSASCGAPPAWPRSALSPLAISHNSSGQRAFERRESRETFEKRFWGFRGVAGVRSLISQKGSYLRDHTCGQGVTRKSPDGRWPCGASITPLISEHAPSRGPMLESAIRPVTGRVTKLATSCAVERGRLISDRDRRVALTHRGRARRKRPLLSREVPAP
jgi:hypothetical protein